MADRTAASRLVALVTYESLPSLTDDDRLLADALVDLGLSAEAVVWSDPDVDWSVYGAIVVRSCWDYFHRPVEFFAWLDRLEREGAPLRNAVGVLRWNADKTYLRDLAARGVAVVPTYWVERGDSTTLGGIRRATAWSELVVKPAISGSAHDTWRASPDSEAADDARLQRMAAAGRVLVQPLMDDIAKHGEWSIVFIDGTYSHSVLKRPREGEFRVQIEHGGTVAPSEPEAGVLRQAGDALRAASATEPPLYARVDGCVIDGRFVLMELELIEPVLFLGTSPGAPERMARALADWMGDQRRSCSAPDGQACTATAIAS